MSDATRAPLLPRPAGSVSLKLLLVLVTAIFGALGISWLPGGREPEMAESSSAALLPPPSDTAFHFGWEVDSASPTGRNYMEAITIPVAVGQQYWLQIVNGAPGGTNRVDSLKGKWNGKNIIGTSDFNSLTDDSERVIAATQTDTLQLLIFGPTTSYVSVAVFSVPDPTFNIFGESTYTKTNSNSQTFTGNFTKPSDAFAKYYLFVVNGDSTGAQRVSSAQVKVNGTIVVNSTDVTTAIGSVVKFVNNVQSGTNEVQVTLTGTANKFVQVRLAASDSTAPVVTLTAPAESSYTNLTNVPVTGTLSDRTAVKVTVNGQAATVTNNTSFSGTANLTTDGWHTLTVVATDVPQLQTTKTRMIKRDTQAPSLTVTSPTDNLYTQNATVTVSGTASDANPFRVNTNGASWTVASGSFGGSFGLSYGANVLVTTSTDTAGNTSIDTRTVTRDTIQPALSVTAPTNGSSTTADSVTVTGTASDANPFTLTVNGIATTVTSGAFSRKVALAVGANTITTAATDGAGNIRSDSRSVTRTQLLPPPPDSVAPPNNPTIVTTLYEATKFLYTGANPIQTGVAPGTIAYRRAAVLRGKVLDSLGAPLPGVTVSIKDHPELGQTLTRAADGRYDLAVNGGGKLTLEFQKAGLLPVQRTVEAPWQDYSEVDSVVLIAPSARVTAITLGSATPIQVVKGDSIVDSNGVRQPLIMFRQGTTATLTLPGGGTQALDSGTIAVRVTEYTRGGLGLERMPGVLPPTSAYTYAAELTVDTALTLGATGVQFSQPVAFYLDNYRNVPVGMTIPLGNYDRATARWKPEPDGRTIKIVSVSGGKADLQVDTTTNQIATQAQLDSLGITDAERTQLASSYAIGKVLWRTNQSHFSPYDWNTFYWILTGAQAPSEPSLGDLARKVLRRACGQSGSVISCENRTLGEAIPITSTPWMLHYQSDRAQGYTAESTIEVWVTGDSVPPGLQAARARLFIAGWVYPHIVPPTPGQRRTFTWNGTDIYGRAVYGPQTATLERCYLYPLVSVTTIGGTGGGGAGVPSFASFRAETGGEVISLPGVDAYTNDKLCRKDKITLGNWSTRGQGLGGWTLSPVHTYDPVSQNLFLGTGERRAAGALGNAIVNAAGVGDTGFAGDGGAAGAAKLYAPTAVLPLPNGAYLIANGGRPRISQVDSSGTITTIAGDGTLCTSGPCGDGGPAVAAKFRFPTGMARAQDGTIYIVDQNAYKVRKIGTDGIISTFAGTGTQCSTPCNSGVNGDGGPATSAAFAAPYGVAVGPDGSVYVSDPGASSVRRISATGTITTIAGQGQLGFFGGDNIVATAAKIGTPYGLAVGPDGAIYFADSYHRRIRKVAPTGYITTVAGNGNQCNVAVQFYHLCGDGGPATSATLQNPRAGLALGPDGSIYIAEPDLYRVRRVDPAGVITLVTGTGERACSVATSTVGCVADDEDGGLAGQGVLHGPEGLAVGPEGTLFLADRTGNEVRQIRPALPGLSATDMLIASEDGSVAYLFDNAGRHKRTLEARTRDTLLYVAYDTAGRLLSVRDGDNNTTTIQRNGSGQPIGIAAPFGQVTTLTIDGNGYLATIANPAGETVRLWHSGTGLLDSLTDPRAKVSAFTYDSTGLLIRDTDPAGGYKQLTVASKTDSNEVVTLSTQLGRTTTYNTNYSRSTDILRTITDPAGLVTRSTVSQSGVTSTTAPDSTVVTLQEVGDPRFGMQSPRVRSLTTTLPSGLTATVRMGRWDSLSNPLDPFSLVLQTDSLILNGDTSLTTYTAANRRLVTTSPLGRQQFTTLDARGRVVTSRVAGLDSVRYVYDGRGRLDSVIDGSRKTKYSYNATSGRLSSVTDPLGRTTQFGYDSAGRITVQTIPDGRQIQFSYDANGNLTSLAPPGRPAHGFQYSSADLAIQYDPPSIPGPKPTKYFYNADRQVDSVVRSDSIAIRFGYDAAGRPASVQFDRGTIGFSYSTASGNLTRITAPGSDTLKFAYDGSLPTKLVWAGPLRDSLQVTYDSAFRVKTQTVHGTSSVGFSYDRDGLLVGAGALRLGRSGTNGLLLADTLNTLIGSYGYTSRGELAGLHQRRGGTTLLGTGYTRDTLGRITQLTDSVRDSGGTLQVRRWSYVYDGVGRLLRDSLDGALHQAFAYDSNGNRTSLTTAAGTVSYSYDAQDRLLRSATSGGTVTLYAYGSNGELRTKTDSVTGAQTRYQYDALGNLLKVVLPSGDSVEYLIDGQNRRVGRKLNGAVTHRWLYQNQLNPVAEFDSAGNLVSRFVYGSRSNVPDYLVKGGSVYRLITDHLGSVRAAVDTATGGVAQWVSYDAWGNVLAGSGAGFQQFGFGGGITDSSTGLVRFGARDYDPSVGRWTAKDPIGFGGGSLGLYTYTENDPVNRIDPSGRFLIPGAVVGGIAGAAISGFTAALTPGATVSSVVSAALIGGITGAVSGALILTPVQAFALGATLGGLANALGQELDSPDGYVTDPAQVALAALTGGLGGLAGGINPPGIGSAGVNAFFGSVVGGMADLLRQVAFLRCSGQLAPTNQ